MEHLLTVGRIPFLVCAPFFHKFLGCQCPGIRFLDGVPSEQNKRLRSADIMLSPSSSIEYARNPKDYAICDKFCTSGTLEIRSVKLFSRHKWENLGGKAVCVTEDSETSACLAKMLSSRLFKAEPVWRAEPFSGESHEARLMIGDKALRESMESKWEYSYDLASVWQDWQGLPFVFGIWIIRKEALSGGLAKILSRYISDTSASLKEFRENRQACLEKWESHYPSGLPQSIACDYYNAVDYSFTEEHAKALRKFYELCGFPADLAFASL